MIFYSEKHHNSNQYEFKFLTNIMTLLGNHLTVDILVGEERPGRASPRPKIDLALPEQE